MYYYAHKTGIVNSYIHTINKKNETVTHIFPFESISFVFLVFIPRWKISVNHFLTSNKVIKFKYVPQVFPN